MPHFVLGRTAALAATLSCGLAAVAHACVHKPPKPQPPVCNTASKHSLGGTNDASDPPVPQPANRYKHHLRRLPGHGGGLTGAASHSPSLSICGPADGGSDGTTTPPSDNSGTPPTDGGSSTPPTDGGTTGSTTPTHGHNGHNGGSSDGGGTTTPPTDGGTTTPPTDGGSSTPTTGGSS